MTHHHHHHYFIILILSLSLHPSLPHQIATLSLPPRCLHISSPSLPPSPPFCFDFSWHDGTNSCSAYSTPNFCFSYGHIPFDATPPTANEACCACGGGEWRVPRFRMGEYVSLNNPQMKECELVVDGMENGPSFRYVVRVEKDCGQRWMRHGEGMEVAYQFPRGSSLVVEGDEEGVVERMVKVELKKCRGGLLEQEFEFRWGNNDDAGGTTTNHHDNDNDENFKDVNDVIVIHKLTNTPLAKLLGATTPLINISQVWTNDLFENSQRYYHMQITTGSTSNPIPMWLMSGFFGEREYSRVRPRSTLHGSPEQQEHSMWTFVANGTVVDDHVTWLETKMSIMGIDYLGEMAPWDLLDVDRTATRDVVKSRFRELGRSFHPDKLLHRPEKRELYEKIFVLIQNAYQNLKGSDEGEKEKFRVMAESDSQLFTHSQHVVELLPSYWYKLPSPNTTNPHGHQYTLNVASHLNTTIDPTTTPVQIWVLFLYSARCGMSRSVRGMVDLAAAHLNKYDDIYVGAYGCGLYTTVDVGDPLGVSSDPICAQFGRMETPNVHVIVETLAGKTFDGEGNVVDVPLDPAVVAENAEFKHFYASVPDGNTVEFFPHNFIEFARRGKRIWERSHLVNKMTKSEFTLVDFVRNSSLVAFFDGIGNVTEEVVDAIRSSLPMVAHRFLKDGLYVGVASCGVGDEEEDHLIDCSLYNVSWLPDLKLYGPNDTVGISLLRGQFGDRRDVQIALESMGNVLRMMLGGEDNNDDDFDEMKVPDDSGDQSTCGMPQSQPPPPQHDENYRELDKPDDIPLLGMDTKKDDAAPELKHLDEAPRKPKLAEKLPELGGARGKIRDRVAEFDHRRSKQRGGGALMGGGGGGGILGIA